MLKNYIKLSVRSLLKNKFYTLFNVLGLTIGITGSFLIFLYLQNELSYDKGFSKASDIYRLAIEYNISGKIDRFSNVPRPVGPKFKDEFPEVVEYTRMAGLNGLYNHEAMIARNDEVKVKSTQIFYADSSYFKIFDHQFIYGNPEKALVEPNSMVINETMSHKLFGKENPIGQVVRLDDGTSVKIKGLIKDFTGNTHMSFDALVSWSTIHDDRDNSRWLGRHVYTYVLLQPTSDPQVLLDKYDAFYEKYMAETFKQLNATNSLIIQPLTKIHLTSDLNWEAYVNGNMLNVYIFSIVVIILLALASINYVNLETARLMGKSKEIGIRKIIGAKKTSLMIHSLVESVLVTLIAVVFTIFLSFVLLPWFNDLSGLNLGINYLSNPEYLFGLVILGIVLGIISGLLPAIYLSNFRTVDSLNSRTNSGSRSPLVRKILVTAQLTVSIGLVICAMTVDSQVLFMKHKNIGFDKENILVIDLKKESVIKQIETVKTEMASISNVIAAASAVDIPGDELNQTAVNATQNGKEPLSTGAQFMQVDYDYLDFIGMNLKEGRFFDKSFGSETDLSVIVNETAVQEYGWEENPLEQKIDFGPDREGNVQQMNVIGVMHDFHSSSLHDKIQPVLVFVGDPMPDDTKLFLKLSGSHLSQTISEIEKKWSKFDRENPMEYVFVDDNFANKYQSEEKVFILLSYFSYLTIAISALGLFGLISFTSKNRRKEISIRKVLGSPVEGILLLLSREFLLLIAVANFLAWPLAYFGMQNWLEGFAYRTGFNISVFLYAGLISIIVTLFTIAYHTIRTAQSNPIKYLRDE